MKVLCIMLAVKFIVVTLGFVDVKITFTDGMYFKYRGWFHLFHKR